MRASLLSSNFTGGELSPAIALGRVDIQKYSNGARRLENVVLTVQGGARRRPGTRYITTVKDQSKRARLIEFVYSRSQAYIIEMGDGYLRFFKNRAAILASGSPYEVSSPYSEALIPSVSFVQKSDTAFFANESVYPWRLQRFADNQWGFTQLQLQIPVAEEQGHFPSVGLTLSSASVGAATVTASATFFLQSDVGRTIWAGGGAADIVSVASSTSASVNIVQPFPSTSIAANTWNLDGSPQATLYPSNNGNVGEGLLLTSDSTSLGAAKPVIGFASGVGGLNLDVTAHGYSSGERVRVQNSGIGIDAEWIITAVPDANTITINSSLSGTGVPAASCTVSLVVLSIGADWLRAEDQYKFLNINGGILQIWSITNGRTADVRILEPMDAAVTAQAGTWVMTSEAWNSRKGFPRAVTISKQRLMFGGSPAYPQHLWASQVVGYLNFLFGSADDQAFRFELDGPRNSPIKHLVPSRELLVLTESDEMSVKGGQEKAISATNIQKTDQSTMGSTFVRPVKIGNETVFVQASGKKVVACGYRFDIDGFASPDRTVFASHITGDGVQELAYQKDPDSRLYAVRSDGQLAVCAYDVEQEVSGWGRWITQGLYESVAVVPTPTAEDAYAVVRRTVGGATKRYVEVFDPDMLVDCGISGTDVAGKATWNGLDHLEGMTVQAWADGTYQGEFVVESGAVTLPRNAFEVQIGLGFTSLVEMLQIEVGGNGATAQGSQIHVNEVILRVLDTSAAFINDQPVEFRQFGEDLLDLPPPLYSGDVRRTTLSDEIFKSRQVITQPYPMPFHLLDVIRRVTINEG